MFPTDVSCGGRSAYLMHQDKYLRYCTLLSCSPPRVILPDLYLLRSLYRLPSGKMEHQAAACLTRTFRPLSRRLIRNCGATRSISSTLRLQTPSRLTEKAFAPNVIPHASSPVRSCSLDHTRIGTRSFSSSVPRSAKAVINPRKDENGNDMVIEIMPRASNVSIVAAYMYS